MNKIVLSFLALLCCINIQAGVKLQKQGSATQLVVNDKPVLLSQVPSFFFPADRALHTEILLRSRGVAASGFRPLCNIPHCCLP